MAETGALDALLKDIRACTICAPALPDGVRPVLRASMTARLCIAGQAPGIRVHRSGIPYDDASGNRLREWLGIDRDAFYDERRVAIIPMGFCFPGYDSHGGDKPPRRECAATWHKQLFATAPQFELTLLVGSYAQAYHLGARAKENVTETVRAWKRYRPRYIPLPHPSWRNNGWLKKNPWFADELLPYLRSRVRRALR
ncbi:MAG TPA: uracil-DNA glycosylase family protein [Rhizomicrobium sp.]|jgi:uracil-DNA glycosylase